MKKSYLVIAIAIFATLTYIGCQKNELANPRDNSTPVTVNTTKQATAASIAIASSVPDSSNIGTTSVVKNSDGSVVKTVNQTLADNSTQTFVSTIDKLGNVSSTITVGSETFTAKGTVKLDGTIHLVRDGGSSTIKSQTIAIKPDNSNIFWTDFKDGTKNQTNVNTDGSIINWVKSSTDVVTSLIIIKANGSIVTDSTITSTNPPVVVVPPIDTTTVLPVDTNITIVDSTSFGPSFSKDIKPILDLNCALSGCHLGSTGKALGDYSIYADFKKDVDNNFVKNRALITSDMPPSSSAGPKSISQADKDKIQEWINSGGLDN